MELQGDQKDLYKYEMTKLGQNFQGILKIQINTI